MEKSKNRTDMLAAGRKKLQQFRQKKDHKASSSSSSHGKSSHKASKTEMAGDDEVAPLDSSADAHLVKVSVTVPPVDADVASDDPVVLPVTALLATLAEGDGVAMIGSKLVPVDSPASPCTRETNGGSGEEKDSEDLPDLSPSESGMRSNQASDEGADCLALDQCNETGRYGDESSEVGTSKLGNGMDDHGSTALEIGTSIKEDATTIISPRPEGGQVADGLSPKPEGGQVADGLYLPAEEAHNMKDNISTSESMDADEMKEDIVTVVSAGIHTAQEVGGHVLAEETHVRERNLGTFSGSLKIEVTKSENERDEMPIASGVDTMDEDSNKKDADAFVNPGLDRSQEADAFRIPAEAVHEAEATLADELGESISHEESLEIMSLAQDVNITERDESLVVLPDAEGEGKVDGEAGKKEDIHGFAFTIESENVGELLERDPISFREIVEGLLPEQRASFLLKSRESVPTTGLWDLQDTVMFKTGYADGFESFKRYLYLTNITKDFLQLQLTEQTDVQKEFDLHLSDEVSRLQDLVKETQESSARVREELAQCRSEHRTMASMKEELEICCLSARREVEELSGQAHELQNKLDLSREESVKLSAELADCNGLLGTLQIENSNLTAQIISGTEEMKKLEAEREYLASENLKFISELSDQRERLVIALAKQDQLEGDLNETMVFLEKLTEENIFLSSSLDIHKSKVKELDDMHQDLIFQAQEFGCHVKGPNVQNIVGNSVIGDSQASHDNSDGEVAPGTLEKSVVRCPEQGLLLQQVEEKDFGEPGVFGVLKGHLEEAEKITQNIEKAIQRMHSHSMSLGRSGGRVTASGVSKLIRAFETKTHHDDPAFDEVPLIEGERSTDSDSFTLAKEQVCNLRATLKQMGFDVETTEVLFERDQDSKKLARELEVECETQKLQNSNLEREIDVLVEKLTEYKLGMDDLQSQLDNTWQNADDTAGRLLNQIESLQEEVNDEATVLERTRDIIRDAISGPIQELDASTGLLVSGNLDVGSHVTASVNAATKTIEDLHEKLKAAYLDRDRSLTSYDELSKEYSDVRASQESAIGMLNRIHSSLGKLISDSCGNAEKIEMDVKVEELLQLLPEDFEILIEHLRKLLNERLVLHSAKSELESEFASRSQDMEELKERYLVLAKNLEDDHSATEDLRSLLMRKSQDIDELNRRCLALAQKLEDHEMCKLPEGIPELVENTEVTVNYNETEIDLVKHPSLRLEALVSLLLQKYEEAIEQVNLSKNYLREVIPQSELSGDNWSEPLHTFLRQEVIPKVMELNELREKVNWLRSSNILQENEVQILEESLSKTKEALEVDRSELHAKVTELEQSEQRISSVREKLGIAVAKGKGLIVQRDCLKQSLMEKSSELEKCLQELQSKEAMLHELEAKLKSYSEAERVEALESELSYIRNSATALRDSFLLKDAILQRIEEVMEDLDLPEHFHSKDVIEKIEWLAKYVAGNSSFPSIDWDQKSPARGSQSDAGFVAVDTWKDDLQPISNPEFDDLKRKYEELQSKFYGLAEHNDMLEQSLLERNNLVQRWEEVLDRINMPLQLRSMESEYKIEWIGRALSEVQKEKDSLLLKIENLEISTDSLLADLEGSQKKISELDSALITVKRENQFLSETLDRLSSEHLEFSEKTVQDELDKDSLQKEIADLKEKLVENFENKEYHEIVNEMNKLQDLVGNALPDHDKAEISSSDSNTKCFEGLLTKLIDNYKILSLEKAVCEDSEDHATEENNLMLEEQKFIELLNGKEQELVALRIELDKVSHNLVITKEERDTIMERYCSQISEIEAMVKQRDALQEERDRGMEKYQVLVSEVEAMGKQRDALQDQLSQEEQRSASVREKLNVAVRKGKGLVQQRDNLKQTIEEINADVDRFKNELNQRVETLQSENLLLRNHLSETEHGLQDSSRTLNGLLTALHAIDLGGEVNIIDPVQKMEEIRKLCHNLRAATLSSEHEAMKSKRASELLLAELNEVQNRADSLQEDLAESVAALTECSREREIAEVAKIDALSHLEQFMIVRAEERKKQYRAVMELKDGIFELRKGYLSFSSMVASVFSMEVDIFCDVQASMESILKQVDGINSVGIPLLASSDLLSSSLVSEENSLAIGTLSEVNMPKDFDDSLIMEHLNLAGHSLHECVKELANLWEKVRDHSSTVDQQVRHLSIVTKNVHSRMSSEKVSSESLKRDITCLEMMKKEMETEMSYMRKNIALLYEACSSSILELENRKTQMIGNSLASEVHAFGKTGMVLKLPICTDGKESEDLHTSFTEDCIRTMADSLLSTVKGTGDIHENIVEGNQRELKTTILDLQRELQEKDIQMNRICAELVSQIKEAESVAKQYSLDLELANSQVCNLENRIKGMEKDQKLLELRVSELKNWEASSRELEERTRTLTDSLTAKDQEIEGLTQALDEEESQMESLQKRNWELEKIVQKNNLALESLEASRAKAMKKLSTTLNRFDELHHLSENLLTEIENLQSQLQGRDSEISFLRQEVTRCTNDVLAEQESNKKNLAELHELQMWMNMMLLRFREHDMHIDDQNCSQIHAYIKFLDKQISSIIAELDDLRVTAQNKDALLQMERGRVDELSRKAEILEISLRDKESQIELLGGARNSGQPSTMNSPESLEINKRSTLGPIAPHVRSGRKVNSDQIAVAIDLEQNSDTLDDEDDDKAHGFKSLTMSRVVPRATRPIADRIDGLWVSIERLLMRQPTLRLGLIIYWVVLHGLLAASI